MKESNILFTVTYIRAADTGAGAPNPPSPPLHAHTHTYTHTHTHSHTQIPLSGAKIVFFYVLVFIVEVEKREGGKSR